MYSVKDSLLLFSFIYFLNKGLTKTDINNPIVNKDIVNISYTSFDEPLSSRIINILL